MNNRELEQLLKNHHRDAFLWARQCCLYDEEDAKEVLQTVYLKIYERKAAYRQESTFKTWLFSVIRFTAIDFLKRKPSFEPLDYLRLAEDDSEEPVTLNYQKLLDMLPDRQQKVLLLSFYHGMTLTEIAGVLDVHIGTVRTHYQRGKEALRQLIQKEQNA